MFGLIPTVIANATGVPGNIGACGPTGAPSGVIGPNPPTGIESAMAAVFELLAVVAEVNGVDVVVVDVVVVVGSLG